MLIKRFFLIVFLFSLLQTGCDETNTNSTTEQTPLYFPLDLGNSWTYAPADTFFGQPFTWEVTYRNGDTATLNRQYPFGSHGGTLTLIDRRNEIDIILDSNASALFYRFKIGEIWDHRDPWECDDSSRWVFTYELNPIITPAGKFYNCIRLERKSAIPCADAGTIVEWWAPGVGLVRWDELNYYVGGPLTIYLKSHSVN